MRISYKWLQRYVDVDASIDEVASLLTRVGLEVESVESHGDKFRGFVVAEVLSAEKHPKADRLKLCSVSIGAGKAPLQIVCGAPNVAAGQKVILGTIGAVVPHDQHDPEGKPFTLTNAVIRGIESFGMLCSGKELGLTDDGSGLMILPAGTPAGTPLAEFLGLSDTSLELGITPNRPDCLCHIGVARDLAAVTGKMLTLPTAVITENVQIRTMDLSSVTVQNTTDCPRYTARMIRNVTVKESPDWLKALLTGAGIRPINNIVDVTNFVMLESGQPMHAFDHAALAGGAIVVKNAAPGEKFTTLDGKTHTLTGSELMICDGERSVALAGVMGGLNSEITNSTTTVLLESAYFLPASVRRTAKRLGISTDASYRFERGIDPNGAAVASDRAAHMIAELSGGEVLGGLIDVYPVPITERSIAIRTNRVNDILGTTLSEGTIIGALNSIGIVTAAAEREGMYTCTVPTFRPDIEQEIDLIEEVARLIGYDTIENKISAEVVFTPPDVNETRMTAMRTWLEANGVQEVVTNSLIDVPLASAFSAATVSVKNPLSAELEVLRPSLAATMLQAVAQNFNHGAQRIQFFEFGTTFSSEPVPGARSFVNGYFERQMLGICLAGTANELAWYEKQRKSDLFDLKGLVASFLRGIGLDNSHLIYYNAPSSLTDSAIIIEINGMKAGSIGQCPKHLLSRYKIDEDVFFAEFDCAVMLGSFTAKRYQPYSRFPTVVRDVAFIVDRSIITGELESTITASSKSITSVTLFDLFEGASIGEGKKSVAFRLTLNNPERTMTEQEIDTAIKAVITRITTQFGAILRSL